GAAKAAGAKCIVGVVTNHNRAVLEKDSRLTLVIDDYLEIPMSKIKQLIN
ncbi:HAD family hydrolase, partial [Lacticaseibacillus rhamnosus]